MQFKLLSSLTIILSRIGRISCFDSECSSLHIPKLIYSNVVEPRRGFNPFPVMFPIVIMPLRSNLLMFATAEIVANIAPRSSSVKRSANVLSISAKYKLSQSNVECLDTPFFSRYKQKHILLSVLITYDIYYTYHTCHTILDSTVTHIISPLHNLI